MLAVKRAGRIYPVTQKITLPSYRLKQICNELGVFEVAEHESGPTFGIRIKDGPLP